MGRKTHGPYLLAAIEYNDITKVSDILSTKFRDKSKVKYFLVSEVRRLASEYTEVPLLLAATLDDPTILKYFVTKHDTNINFVHEYGFQKPKKRKTALLVAVRRGLYAMVDTILALNGDVNIQDHKGRSALHHAVRRADYRMAKLLLSRGAQVSIVDMNGNSPLHIATIFGHMELVRLLLRQGGDLYKKGQFGAIPIHIAAKEGHASLVRMFVEQCEVNVNIKVPCYDEREKAPLHVAAMEGHAETVFTLLEHCRAEVNIRDSEGETPLHCVALHEYDPLGMKSKEDFTETVKVLLNYGAEVNTRNDRGETALHLASRNEFQKVVEVLVRAGSDPLIEDNDKNKPIDLVAPEDTVSKQTLKNAMADREQYMAEALEVRARGFTTNLQNRLPFSGRSQSTMNMPLAVHGHNRLYSNHGSTFGSTHLPLPYSGSAHQIYGGQFRPSSQSQSSSSGSKRRSKDSSIPSVAKLPPSMVNLQHHRPPAPMSAVRKAKSVEDLDYKSNDRFYTKSGSVSQMAKMKKGHRGRKNSYQESETTSFWDVTPPGSFVTESDLESRRSGKKKKSKSVPKLMHDGRLNESDEELDRRPQKVKAKKQEVPMKFVAPRDTDDKRSFGGDDSDYYLDDDDSVDALEVERMNKEKRREEKRMLTEMKNRELQMKPGLSSWLDEQVKLLKSKEKPESGGPVAHSTPPLKRNAKQKHDDSDDDISSDDSSDSDSGSDVPVVVPVAVKPKPAPPPKPAVKNSVARLGVPVLPVTAGKESLKPRNKQFQKDNQDIERVIELEVNESFDQGETVIRVIPVSPAGPSKVHTIGQGAGSTTFLRLQGDAAGSFSAEPVEVFENQTKNGHKKAGNQTRDFVKPEVKSKNDVQNKVKGHSGDIQGQGHPNKSKDSQDGKISSKDKKPVAKPRDAKADPTSTKKNKFQSNNISDSETSSGSSDEHAVATPSTMKAGTGGGKLSQGNLSASAPQSKVQSQELQKPAGLVFQKAGDTSGGSSKSGNRAQQPVTDSGVKDGGKRGSGGEKQGKRSSGGNKTNQPRMEVENSKRHGSKHQRKKNLSDSFEEESGSEETESSEEEESEEDVDGTDEGVSSSELRTININSDGNLDYTLVGGNVDGVFVHSLDRSSEAARKGLLCGDQILKANDQVVYGRTRDEAMQILHSINGPLSLIVRKMPQNYRAAVKNEGANDSLFVRAHFSSNPSKRGELAVHEGEVFCVSDTFPENNVGSWKARKMNAGTDEDPNGFIPNQAKADQITIKQRLSQGKAAPDQRGGAFLRSFRRAKSADRNSKGQDDDDKILPVHGVVSYEKVAQRISNARRPVVILGLFCDVVINRLVKEVPEQFETPAEKVENLKDTESPVNARLLHVYGNNGKHCVIILAPPSIEYLQQKTDLNPIVIYLSPVSKALVKNLKTKLAPFYNKNAGYMYDEAVKFEKNYAHLFSATVPYTNDDWWFFHLKEAITRIQNQPTWQSLTPDEIETRVYSEISKIIPTSVVRQPKGQTRQSRDKTARMSRTTDDLPRSPPKLEQPTIPEVSINSDVGPRSILKQQSPSVSSSGSSQGQLATTTFHRLHSHNFDETKFGSKKRTQPATSHVTQL